MLPLMAAVAVEPRAACDLAASWVDGLGNTIPSSPDAIAELPVTYQRAVLGKLPREIRVAVLSEQIGAFLEPEENLTPFQRRTRHQLDRDLTPAQQDLLRTLRSKLPALFDFEGGEPDGKALRLHALMRARALQLFDRDTYDRVLNRVGPMLSPSQERRMRAELQQQTLLPGESAFGDISAKLHGTAGRRLDCNCDSNGDCLENYYCLQTSPPCSEVNTCFTTLFAKCNGRCQFFEMVPSDPTTTPPNDTIFVDTLAAARPPKR